MSRVIQLALRSLLALVVVGDLALAGPLVDGAVQETSTRAPSAPPDDAAAQRDPSMAPAVSPPYDPSLFASLKWRNIGPNRGGRSTAVAGTASRPLEYYFGATGGGLWKTTDGGQTWTSVGDKELRTSSVGAVAVAPSNPDVVYVGMGETQLRGNIIQGDGVYKSTDAGKTWAHAGLAPTMAIARVRVHPANPDIVYVAALGHPYAPSPDRGVFKTIDGGQTWTRVLFRDEKTGAVDLALDPANPEVVYASLWEVFRTPHSLSSGGPGSGLFKSTDGGATWSELTRNPGFPVGVWGKSGVAVSPADASRVYVILENATGGVFASDDAGATWKLVSNDRRLRQRAFYYTRVYADPREKDTVYVLNTGFYRSADGGKTYRAIKVPHGDNHDLWIAPDDPRRMINSNDGGANVSTNGGDTWTDQDVPTAQFYNVITTRHLPYHVCGAQQDNSTACVPSTGGPLYAVGGCESGYIAPDPADPDVFYAGCYGGMLTRFDRRTGQSQAVNVWPDNPMGQSAGDLRERVQWTFPIVFSPVDPSVLYTTSQHVWKTTTGGQRWERISPDLTRADSTTLGPSGGPITLDQTGVETYATVFTLAPSRHEANTIWAGSDDGLVHVTRDGGGQWEKITPPDLPPFARISLIEASPHKAGTAFVAANLYQRGDRGPYVYRTDDYGSTWAKIVEGLPADDFARVIREDPKRAGLLYLGTEHGIHVSFDSGARWQSLRLELPVTPVHGIAVEEHDLVIGTHGRSFWILPGIDLLRQLTPETAASPVWLVAPGRLVRYRIAGAWGSSTPSLAIDYVLQQEAETVTVEILDAAGQAVRTLTGSADEDKQAEERKKEASATGGDPDEEEAGPPKARPARKAGHNRVLWDLRYQDAVTFPKLIMWAAGTRGPLAPPGTYTVRLTANGRTVTQPFEIVRDPRLAAVTDDDLREQFRFAREIHGRLSQANAAVVRIRALRAQVDERVEQARDVRLRAAALSLSKTLTAVEGEIYQYRNQSSQDPLNYPIKLNNRIGALLGIVESADGRPTEQSYAVFEELTALLDKQLARLDGIVGTDVPAFNLMAARAKLAPVVDAPAGGPAR
jgi:photosystem II stability/assembly factor-like uncharacterized protein